MNFFKLFYYFLKYFIGIVIFIYKILQHWQRSKLWYGIRKIVDAIKHHKIKSRYSHTNQIDNIRGVYEVNCYGLLNSALQSEGLTNALNEVREYIKNTGDVPRPFDGDGQPCPLHYVHFFRSKTSKNYWLPIVQANHLRPGDVIAYTSESPNPKPDVGQHIMVVSNMPTLASEAGLVWVPIFDSTKFLHGPEDTRRRTGGGIGEATIGLEINNDGTPSGIRWRWTLDRKKRKSLPRIIAMARPLDGE